jgi:translation initiation factor IF-1
MGKKENIRLDARLLSVVGEAAFRAELANGHQIIAFLGKEDRANAAQRFKPGQAVGVEFSPYDMSKGRILVEA